MPFEKDYARIEDKETINKLHNLTKNVYSDLGYEIVEIPAMPIEKRVKNDSF